MKKVAHFSPMGFLKRGASRSVYSASSSAFTWSYNLAPFDHGPRRRLICIPSSSFISSAGSDSLNSRHTRHSKLSIPARKNQSFLFSKPFNYLNLQDGFVDLSTTIMDGASSSPDRDVSMLDTPGYTDSEDAGTRASSVAGDLPSDNRKRQQEQSSLRKNLLGKKHGALVESKVILSHISKHG